ncbi:hypothetical protein JTB14_013567 [Gonioctena quinquepunctata]|nr:hypothetical protein JTB14_013567 [Gonioctena quinquepunctata]
MVSCERTIKENGTYFVNNGYPNQYDGSDSCQVTLLKSAQSVCQFRLNFEQLNLMGPEPVNNICNYDQFLVSGGNPTPVICGESSGNHTEAGCLQYFTGVTGQILSFNYNPETGAQLSNQDYGICVRVERNFCGIQYTQCSDPEAVDGCGDCSLGVCSICLLVDGCGDCALGVCSICLLVDGCDDCTFDCAIFVEKGNDIEVSLKFSAGAKSESENLVGYTGKIPHVLNPETPLSILATFSYANLKISAKS